MDNIIRVKFTDGSTIAMADDSYQYDYGMILKIEGVDLPQSYEVLFSNKEFCGEAKPMIGDENGVEIPDEYFLSGEDIYCFLIHHTGENDGRTEKKIIIPNTYRPMRNPSEPTPVQQDIIEQAIAALNIAVEQTAADVQTTCEYKEEARGYAEQASDSADEAKGYAERAEGAVSEISGYAERAETAESHAQGYAQTASDKASEASGYASDAQGYSNSASSSASDAHSYASDAYGYAESAYQSYQGASGYAHDANTYAQSASGSASDASSAKDLAVQAKDDAISAKNDAVSAKNDAVQAKDDAVSAKDSAEGFASDAQGYAESAQEVLESIPADYSTLSDDVDNLKNALDECFYNINDSASLWEQGTISTSGNESSSSISIRTGAYLAKNIVEIEPVTGWKFMLYAWNATTGAFVGIYKNGTFVATTNWLTGNLLISGLQNYNLRVVARKTDESAITPADFAGMRLLVTVDNTLTKEFVPADAKETGSRIAENSSAISAFSDAVDDLDNATFVYAYSEKQVTDVSTSKTGFNASISGGNTIGLGANANLDTYYWFAKKDTKLYVDATNVAYLAICIGTNPTVDDFVWSSASAATLPCESAYRVRKSEGNLPTADNPIILTKGDAVAITVTSGATCPVFLWEKTNVAKVDTITANGVACNVQAHTVTITGNSYKVIFSKLTTTQGYQWNITSLSGADGQNMFPAAVDIIGVIQFIGGSNFMGGVHGNESNYEFRVMADGADVSGAVVKDEIHIIMSSHLYDPDNTANNVVDRFVEFVFTTKGWTCRNTFKILVNAQIQVAYPSGLFAFTASDCDGAYSNVGTLNLASTSERQLQSTDFKEITMNLPGKFTLNIKSETADKGWVTYRSNTTSFKVYFANAELETVTSGAFISGKCEYRF